jgi:polyisoprenoid-binding protein YceI
MISSVFTTVVALSALSVALVPMDRRHRTGGSTPVIVAGGPPDTLVASPSASSFRWKGTGLGGRGAREGTVSLASGMFVIRHEKLTSGNFVVNMRSVDPALRGSSMFDVERHPTAVFQSTGMTRVGEATWRVAGNLTLRGVTRPLAFDSEVSWPEMGHMIATSSFTIDRREFGIGNGVARAADALVDDDIQLAITLDARRKQAKVATR